MQTVQILLTLSLTISYYWSSLLVSPLDSTQCLHRADECKFLLVGQHGCVHILCLRSKNKFMSLSHLSWLICEMGGKWPCNCSFFGCCLQNLFKTACRIFVLFPSSFFARHFIKVQMVQLYNSTDSVTTWKNSHFILSESRRSLYLY